MQLSNYSVYGHGSDNRQIRMNNSNLKNLEDLLNTNLRNDISINFYLNDLNELISNWDNPDNLNNLVENKYGDFWDSEILDTYGVDGTWFNFMGYEDFSIYISVENQEVYIENDLFPQYPVVQMPISEFIDILEQWLNM